MYAKIFRQIYEGSLCTRGPWQALVTFQQFLILSDRFGVVDMTREAISRISTVPLDIIEIGIKALEQEDSDSRNPSLHGRRIIRLAEHRDWGWQIVNYQEFAKIRSAEERREYQRKYKQDQRKKEKESKVSTPVNIVNRDNPSTQLNSDKKNIRSSSDDHFDKFWLLYPNKAAKKEAQKAWKSLNPDDELRERIFKGVTTYAILCKTREKKHIKHGSGWLNGRRWEDEGDIDPVYAGLIERFGEKSVTRCADGCFYVKSEGRRYDKDGKGMVVI